jgi:hypothetical protein
LAPRQKELPTKSDASIRHKFTENHASLPERAEGDRHALDHGAVHDPVSKIVEISPDIHPTELTAGTEDLAFLGRPSEPSGSISL